MYKPINIYIFGGTKTISSSFSAFVIFRGLITLKFIYQVVPTLDSVNKKRVQIGRGLLNFTTGIEDNQRHKQGQHGKI